MIKDTELKKRLELFANNLSKNKKFYDLVQLMKPLEVVQIMKTDLDLHAKEALYLYVNVFKEFLQKKRATIPFEKNQYPVPNVNQREVEENYVNSQPVYIFSDTEFPPKPRKRDNDWPYDPNTLFISDPKNKKRRPLLQSKDLTTNKNLQQPGISGLGIFQKNNGSHTASGNMPDATGNITTRGYPGLSSSPQGKEFDLPEVDDKNMYTSQDNKTGGLVKSPVVFFGR